MEYKSEFRDKIALEVVLLGVFQFLHGLQYLMLSCQFWTTPTPPDVFRILSLIPLVIDVGIAILYFSRHVIIFIGALMYNMYWALMLPTVLLDLSLMNMGFVPISLVSISILILLFTSRARMCFLYYPNGVSQ
ncbi:MAG: hypothetical protein ACFFEJ_19095 [Candidatus Thorarchaeota archaeon]